MENRNQCIRILQVVDRLEWNSGVSSVVMNYYNYIDTSEVIFDFLTHGKTDEQTRKQIEQKGSRIYEMPSLTAGNMPTYYRSLEAFYKEHAKDYPIIHGHIPNAAWFYLGLAKKYQVPVRILHSHSSIAAEKPLRSIRNKILISFGKRKANQYFACSKVAAQYMFGDRAVASGKVKIIYNAIDVERFAYKPEERNAVREELGLSDNYVVGHVGRFTTNKNQGFLVDLLKEIKDESVVLVLVGAGETQEAVKQKVTEVGLEKRVRFLGIRSDVERILQAMDVFLLPSYHEGLPVSCVEAQVSGLKCLISSRVTKETDITNQCEFLDIQDKQAWIDYLRKQIEEGSGAERITGISERFDIRKESKQLIRLYQNLLGYRSGKDE